jgi:hypothetical protein
MGRSLPHRFSHADDRAGDHNAKTIRRGLASLRLSTLEALRHDFLDQAGLLTGAWLWAPSALAAARAAQAREVRTGGPFVAKRRGVFNGKTVDYFATLGETVLTDAQGAPRP